jgi:hypothetical protein
VFRRKISYAMAPDSHAATANTANVARETLWLKQNARQAAVDAKLAERAFTNNDNYLRSCVIDQGAASSQPFGYAHPWVGAANILYSREQSVACFDRYTSPRLDPSKREEERNKFIAAFNNNGALLKKMNETATIASNLLARNANAWLDTLSAAEREELNGRTSDQYSLKLYAAFTEEERATLAGQPINALEIPVEGGHPLWTQFTAIGRAFDKILKVAEYRAWLASLSKASRNEKIGAIEDTTTKDFYTWAYSLPNDIASRKLGVTVTINHD